MHVERSQTTARLTGLVRRAFTIAELLVTVAILGALTTLVVPMLSQRATDAAQTVTRSTLEQARSSLRNYYADMYETLPYPADPSRARHPQLAYLYVNPNTFAVATDGVGNPFWSHNAITHRGWAGPYLVTSGRYTVNATAGFTTRYGNTGDPAVMDGWGNPIVLQQPALQLPGSMANVFSHNDRTFARLVSAGPNGVLETPQDVALPTSTGDDLILTLRHQP